MATYSIRAPNGQTYQVDGPEGATDQQVQAEVLRQHPDAAGAASSATPLNEAAPDMQGGFADELPQQVRSTLSPEDTATLQGLYRTGSVHDIQAFIQSRGRTSNLQQLQTYVANRDKGAPTSVEPTYDFPQVQVGSDPLDARAGAVGRGVGDTLFAGTLPKVGAAIAAGEAALTGGDAGQAYDRMLDQNNAVVGSDEENHPWARVSGQLASGALLPMGLAGITARAETAALAAGKTLEEAHAIGQAALRSHIVKASAGYGAAHGGGSGDTVSDAVTGALTEGAIGAATGGVVGQAGRILKPRIPLAANPVAEAAGRQGIDVLPADVGGPATRMATAITAQTPFGAIPIVRAANQANAQGAKVLESQAATIGDAAKDVEGLGTAATEGALRYSKAAKNVGGRMYDIAVQKGGNVLVDLKAARETLDSQIARLKAVPGGGQGLEEAQALRSELDKPFSVQGIRDWRTENFIDPKFRNTPVEGRMRAVVTAASRDVDSALRASGNIEAADLYAAADDHWRNMLANLKRNIEPIVGKLDNLKSAEAVANALTSASKNNGARLGAFLSSLPQDERGVVTATFLSPLGKDASGAFSLSRFEQDWEKMSPIAKRMAFPAETRAALDDLATVGKGAKQAMRYSNHSNSGSVIMGEKLVGSFATGSTLAIGMKTLGTALAGQYGMGRLLASPRFARWLARAPRTSLAPHAYVERLTRIARAEPAIANEVLHLQERLTRAFGDQAFRAAAQEDGDKADGRNREQGKRNPQQQSPTP